MIGTISSSADDDERLIADLQRNNTQAGKEALAFTQQYVDKAKIFIEAIRQREETMARTMTAIIHRQRQYFITGDETDLAPMKLKDIARPRLRHLPYARLLSTPGPSVSTAAYQACRSLPV